MNRWEELGTTSIPNDGGQLRLLRRGDEFSIRIAGTQGDLMNSRMHSSEDALGTLPCELIANRQSPRVLIGGLGMGFTLAAVLAALPEDAKVVVAELVPGVVDWNRQTLGECAGYPLVDKRTEVVVVDVGDLIEQGREHYDAILLDVDNGPEALTHADNSRLYSVYGLSVAYNSLRSGGVLAVWSASAAPDFSKRLRNAGFSVQEKPVRAHKGKGARHMIWLASKRTQT